MSSNRKQSKVGLKVTKGKDPNRSTALALDTRFDGIRRSAAERPHGTRARYVASRCRCLPCRAANARYQSARDAAKRAGDYRGLVSAAEAQRYIDWLGTQGIGYKSVAAAASITTSVVAQIKYGKRRRIRASTSRQILAVDRTCAADHARVDGKPTWRLLQKLINAGYTQTWIARQLGAKSKTPRLQFARTAVLAITASRVERLYRLVDQGRISR